MTVGKIKCGVITLNEKRGCSIAKIAQICGVSKATVSRVINNNPNGVGEETRKRVLKTIEELKYRPNSLARGVATSHSNMIGLVVPDVSNFFYPKIIRGVMDYMDDVGYSVILGNSDYNPEREAHQLLHMIDKRVDGIILCSGVSNHEFLSDFRKYDVPLGLVGRSFDHSLSDTSITGDNIRGGFKSTSYLIRGGNRRIVYIEGNPGLAGSQQRLEGYRKAHRDAGIPICEELILSGDYSIDYGRQAVDDILDRGLKFDAIMTGSDLIAIGVVNQLQHRGIRVPEDVEVIGFDNIELTTVVNPPLSTVSKPHYQMAQHISQQLLSIINGEQVILPHMIVEPQLVLRNTTRERSYDSEYC